LLAGTYSVTVKTAMYIRCNISVTITAQPATPSPTTSNIVQPTCAVATGSVKLIGLPSGTWTINPGNIMGSTSDYTISGLTAGTYKFTATNFWDVHQVNL
jgi:hypothetical protein